MSTPPRVGGEVDAFCTKCELLLAHTILAMVGPKIVRVRCETCKGEHSFRGQVVPKGAAKPRAPRTSAAEKAEKVIIAWEERLKGSDLTKARKYSPKETFAVEEVINHPTFGYGIVSAVRGDKMDIAFKAFEKTLMCKRPDGKPAQPTFNTKATAKPQPKDADANEAVAAPEAGDASQESSDGGTVAP